MPEPSGIVPDIIRIQTSHDTQMQTVQILLRTDRCSFPPNVSRNGCTEVSEIVLTPLRIQCSRAGSYSSNASGTTKMNG